MGLDDILDAATTGTAWGLAAAVAVGAALLAGKGARPVAKSAIKGCLVVAERARELGAGAAEQLHDIYAEARAQIEGDDGERSDDIVALVPPAEPTASATT